VPLVVFVPEFGPEEEKGFELKLNLIWLIDRKMKEAGNFGC
jgi:hypothetical protein